MLKLLIVDDDRIVLEGLHKFVDWNRLGCELVGTALNAKSAIDFMQNEHVDILLTDIMMPKEDGFNLIEEALLINPYMKTVILSGYSQFDFARKAIKLKVFDYLTKPVDFEELERIFTQLCKISVQENEERLQKMKNKADELAEVPIETETEEKSVGPVVEMVLDYVKQHYAENITLPMLAEKVYVHPVYLSKLFKEKMGINFIDYLTKVRIEKAKVLLSDLSFRIYDISEMVGYTSPKHFSKNFKTVTNLTPKEYRQKSAKFTEKESGDANEEE